MVQPKCNTLSIIISIGGLTPLHNAARNGHSEDNFGLTPLHDAAKLMKMVIHTDSSKTSPF